MSRVRIPLAPLGNTLGKGMHHAFPTLCTGEWVPPIKHQEYVKQDKTRISHQLPVFQSAKSKVCGNGKFVINFSTLTHKIKDKVIEKDYPF